MNYLPFDAYCDNVPQRLRNTPVYVASNLIHVYSTYAESDSALLSAFSLSLPHTPPNPTPPPFTHRHTYTVIGYLSFQYSFRWREVINGKDKCSNLYFPSLTFSPFNISCVAYSIHR